MYIALGKAVAGIIANLRQIVQIAGIGEQIQIDNKDVLIIFQQVVHKV